MHQVSTETAGQTIADGDKCGYCMINGYVAAVVDPWIQQVSTKINSYPHPRTKKVKKLLDRVKGCENTRQRSSYVDRGLNKLL